MWRPIKGLTAVALAAWAGPVEFGWSELQKAAQDRGLKAGQLRLRAELNTEAPESFRIAPGLVTGGDLRGLMYGLLEAAEQIRENGRLTAVQARPATPIRGIRWLLHNRDLEQEWYYSREQWRNLFGFLARCRFNRFNLVFAHQTNYLAPPYPFWPALNEFPEVRAPGLAAFERERNLQMLRWISDAAAEHGIDFTLGVWEHNVQRGMTPTVVGLTRDNIGPYSYAALRRVLEACPGIRSVQLRTNAESGIPPDRQIPFYRDYVFRALHDAGRRVTLDLPGRDLAAGTIQAARSSGVPLRVSAKYWGKHLGRPYPPAETFPDYSYMNLLEKPRSYEFFWEVWALGSHRILLWGDPDYVRRAVPTFTLSGTAGFEIDPPPAQKGFGDQPGKWSIFTEKHRDLSWWKWEYERYWFFYLLWGRLSYDPKTPERAWRGEFKRRFGAAAPEALEAYKAAGGVLNEIVAVHMADPNTFNWPEVNPGGLLDAYIEVRPSDWRYVASIPEAVNNRLEGVPSAKQTPQETAARLREMAARIERAVARVQARGEPTTREWRASEPDFLVLAHLARYHAHKQLAAYELAWFYRTADAAALRAARREAESAREVWESLVRLTDGLYPAGMAAGPDEVGHWKDGLPYVMHDLRVIKERERIYEQFGRFLAGFDFEAPAGPAKDPASFRNTPYVWGHTVERRFQAVGPETEFSEQTGYGWVGSGPRRAHALAPTPYAEIRAAARHPRRLPENVLYGDWIEGAGPQRFRVRTGEGRFRVAVLEPDGSHRTHRMAARNGYLDVVFPEGAWRVSGLVIRPETPEPEGPPVPRAQGLSRPRFAHLSPKAAPAGKPLQLALQVSPASAAVLVRLHYRPLNQLAAFKTIEARGVRPVFLIPGEELPPRWDLMYYFEILNPERTGWFQPDPRIATPYYVVSLQAEP